MRGFCHAHGGVVRDSQDSLGELQGRRRVASRVLHWCWRRCRGALRPVFVNTSVTRGGIPSAPSVCTGRRDSSVARSASGTGTTIAVAATVQNVCFIHTFGSQ